MEALTPWHLVLILVGFMLLFGYKKLPDATRSLGRSLRIFKTEMREMNSDEPRVTPATAAVPAPSGTARSEPSVADLEAEARHAEAEAAELRARLQAHAAGRTAAP